MKIICDDGCGDAVNAFVLQSDNDDGVDSEGRHGDDGSDDHVLSSPMLM